MSEKLDRMKTQKEKAEQKLRYYQHQEKMLEHRIPELTRKARTHRLCTRGGMLESFLICPGELTDDQVMELLKLSFRQQEVALALAKMIHDLQEARNILDPSGWRAQLYTGRAGALRSAGGFLRKADDFQHTCGCFQSSQETLHFPCAGCASYPFVDLPPGNTLRCKLFPFNKFTKSRYTYPTGQSIINQKVKTAGGVTRWI